MFKPTLNAFIHKIHSFKFANLYSKNVLEQKHEYFCRNTHSVHIQKETNTEQIPHRKIRKSKYQKAFWQHEGEMTERKREIERQTNVLTKFPLTPPTLMHTTNYENIHVHIHAHTNSLSCWLSTKLFHFVRLILSAQQYDDISILSFIFNT